MKKCSSKVLCLAVLVVLPASTLALAQTPTVVMAGSIVNVDGTRSTIHPQRPFISRTALTSDETNEVIRFNVALQIRNFSELKARVGNKEHIPLSEMVSKYQPRSEDYQAVSDWLVSQGFKITLQSKTHLAVFVSGTVSQIQKAFGVHFAKVRAGNNDYTSAISAPSVPDNLAPLLVGINGLQPHIRTHTHLSLVSGKSGHGPGPMPRIFSKTSQAVNLSSSETLSLTEQFYSPQHIGALYHADTLNASGIVGANEAIAIIIDAVPSWTDLENFWSTFPHNSYYYQLTQSNLPDKSSVVFVPALPGTNPNPDTQSEATLDVEWASAMAPGAQVRVYYMPDLTTTSEEAAFETVYSDATTFPTNLLGIHQMSMSFGLGEIYYSPSDLQTEYGYFMMLNSAGVTPFAASGDAGATPADDPKSGFDETGPLMVEYPAADPNVIAVGGTYPQFYSDGSLYVEPAWSNSGGGYAANPGGGTPSWVARQSWQTGSAFPAGSTRLVPDVAADADYGDLYFTAPDGTIDLGVSGTSLATPIWAAFCALLNQVHNPSGVASGVTLVPFASHIYPLFGYASFTDITSGSNSTPNSGSTNGVPNYTAGPGYDLVTGLGVPNVQQMSYALSPGQQPPIISGTPPDAPIGAPYNFTYTYKGTIAPAFSLASGSLPPGLYLLGSGTIYGTPTQVGSFSATINASTPGGTNSLTCNITVNPANFFVKHVFVVDGTVTNDGQNPNSLVQGSDGNLYGTTAAGGSVTQVVLGNTYHPDGTFFQMTPAGKVSILHNFGDGTVPNDGTQPNAGLVQGSDGSFYGSTAGGGPIYGGENGVGSIFKMTASGSETNLTSASFNESLDLGYGLLPFSQLNGNFYSAAYAGPAFVMTPQGAGTILHSFPAVPLDGVNPTCMVLGKDGNFYGTTKGGGPDGGPSDNDGTGTAFVINSSGSESIIHQFSGDLPSLGIFGGGTPPVGIVQAANGTFYGTTSGDGTAGYGEFFSMTTGGSVTTLHNFGDGSVVNDGQVPDMAPILGTDGNFYGTTSAGGANGNGVVYQMTPQGNVNILHSFSVNDGNSPHTLIQGSDGNLYGTTYSGQGYQTSNIYGEIFEIGKLTQTINNFGPVGPQTVGGTVSLDATASSGLSVTYTVSGPATLTYITPDLVTPSASSNAYLTLTGPGSVSVTASVSGTAVYYPATSTQTFQVTSTSLSLLQWESQPNFFTALQLSEPNVSGPSATPQYDGVSNLLKYLYDINPARPMTATDRAALPVVGVTTVSGTQYLELTYRQNALLTGITVNVQTSTDLKNWTTANPPGLFQQVGTDGTTGDPIVEVGVKTNSVAKMFIRLNVTEP